MKFQKGQSSKAQVDDGKNHFLQPYGASGLSAGRRCLVLASCSAFSHSSRLTPSSAALHRGQDRSQSQLHPPGGVQAVSERRGVVPGAFPGAKG